MLCTESYPENRQNIMLMIRPQNVVVFAGFVCAGIANNSFLSFGILQLYPETTVEVFFLRNSPPGR